MLQWILLAAITGVTVAFGNGINKYLLNNHMRIIPILWIVTKNYAGHFEAIQGVGREEDSKPQWAKPHFSEQNPQESACFVAIERSIEDCGLWQKNIQPSIYERR